MTGHDADHGPRAAIVTRHTVIRTGATSTLILRGHGA